MAKIEMDMSEYEAMKKVEKLLHESLDREKQNNDKISALEQEKITLLESNEKVVTIINRRSTVETIYTQFPAEEIMKRVQNFFSNERRGNFATMDIARGDFRGMIDMFFQKTVNELSGNKEVTRQGLDEVTAQIRKELKADLSEEVERELEALKSFRASETERREELSTLSKANKAQRAEILINSEVITELRHTNNDVNEELAVIREAAENRLTTIVSFKTNVENIPTNIFNKKFKKRVIANLISTKYNDKG